MSTVIPFTPEQIAQGQLVQLDDLRSPHSERAKRLRKMALPVPHDIDRVRLQLRRCHRDPALRAQILALMKAQAA